jgi:predicted lipoprotein with Yx(FWY)xxD motif
MSTRHLLVTLPAAAAVALTAAACGAGGSYGGNGSAAAGPAGPYASAAPVTPPRAITVSVRRTKLGRVLVDGNGRTLYLFARDMGTKSSCSGACAQAWPPLLSSGTVTDDAAGADQVGVAQRGATGAQVTFAGHPLYLYAGDSAPGDTNGQGLNQFGAPWYAVSPDGHAIHSGS